MNEFKVNTLISGNKKYIIWFRLLSIGIAGVGSIAIQVVPFNMLVLPNSTPNNQAIVPSKVNNQPNYQPNNQASVPLPIQNRPLNLTISVDSPSFLKVKVGQEISKGDVISDNSLERSRLDKQRKSLLLQIDNLKSKTIPTPSEPKKPPALVPLPEANYVQETSAIASSQLKLQQAQTTLENRTPGLQTDNPEKRADTENAESAMQQAQEKVKEQEELLKNMQDMKLEPPIIRHEEAKLKQIQSDMNQAQSALEREKAKLNASAIASSQELQNLKIAVQIAQSDLQMATSKLETAKSSRKAIRISCVH